MQGKLIVFSAPSGSGKTTIINSLMRQNLNLAFSVSATSRPPREGERNGISYFFLTPDDFRQRIARGDFLEHEEVYAGIFYGTLRSQVENQLARGQNVVLDVDVNGACNIKKTFGARALTLFIAPPSIDELRRRLLQRATESPQEINRRIARAAYELAFAPRFDAVIVNDNLTKAQNDALEKVKSFLKQP